MEGKMYHARLGWGLSVAFAVAWVLSGCAGVEPRSESRVPEPPAWNSPEMMMMDTEIVSVDGLWQKYMPTRRASEMPKFAAAPTS